MHPAEAWFRRGWRTALTASAALAALACEREPEQAPALRLVDVRPRERSSVYLNEPLVLHFSSELDRTCVTETSVRIVTPEGLPARGTRFVLGRELMFVPDPVRAPDLMDGGYAPDTTYVIELAGFPRAEALRGTDGACLSATLRIQFKTVSIKEPRGTIFDDGSPGRGQPLHLRSEQLSNLSPPRVTITPESGLELEGDEPLDPSTLQCDALALVRIDGSGERQFPLRPVLIDNHNKFAFPSQGTTIVRLLPHVRLEKGDYRLSVDRDRVTFLDFSGRQVPVIGQEVLRQLVVRVSAGQGDTIEGEYLEEFVDAGMRSSALVPGVDATALWSRTGRLEVRFPAAAGDGSEGEVVLGARERRPRLSAEKLTVPAGVETLLDGGPGLCVLRSQGRLEIAGSLTRAGTVQATRFPEVRSGDTVTAWLERQSEAPEPLTVLVAGGDLLIRGELSVPGALLLVAGGRVLVSGRVRVADGRPVESGSFKDLGESGAIALWSVPIGPEKKQRTMDDAGLVLDPPLLNPLRRRAVYCVRSNPIPRDGRAVRWLSAEELGARPGAGAVRVHYAGERFAGSSGALEVLVDDPVLLVDCPNLRLVLELEVPAASEVPDGAPADYRAPWDPPSLDAVRVRWKTQ